MFFALSSSSYNHFTFSQYVVVMEGDKSFSDMDAIQVVCWVALLQAFETMMFLQIVVVGVGTVVQ